MHRASRKIYHRHGHDGLLLLHRRCRGLHSSLSLKSVVAHPDIVKVIIISKHSTDFDSGWPMCKCLLLMLLVLLLPGMIARLRRHMLSQWVLPVELNVRLVRHHVVVCTQPVHCQFCCCLHVLAAGLHTLLPM